MCDLHEKKKKHWICKRAFNGSDESADFSFRFTIERCAAIGDGGCEKSRGLLRDFTISGTRGVSPPGKRVVEEWEGGGRGRRRLASREQIRNCRHIENHNSCEWRQTRGIPGAYRGRYLDRVTINTDPGEGGPGALSEDRVAKSLILTYTPSSLLLSLATNPLRVFRLLPCRSDTAGKVIIFDTREIPGRSLCCLYALYMPREGSALVLSHPGGLICLIKILQVYRKKLVESEIIRIILWFLICVSFIMYYFALLLKVIIVVILFAILLTSLA